MADYWKSYEKKYCDICKCWLSGNKASIEFHENGKSHQANVQRRLKDIQRKTRNQEKEEKKMNKNLGKIMRAAEEASKKDQEENPDMSLKIKAYEDYIAEQAGASGEAAGAKLAEELSNKPKILHRDEKKVKKDNEVLEQLAKPIPVYNSKGGWKSIPSSSSASTSTSTGSVRIDLELPSESFIEEPTVKKSKYDFEEKKIISLTSAPVSSGSSYFSFVKSEPIGFKKRKFAGNMRKREEDN